jgi:hypothetical protein
VADPIPELGTLVHLVRVQTDASNKPPVFGEKDA